MVKGTRKGGRAGNGNSRENLKINITNIVYSTLLKITELKSGYN